MRTISAELKSHLSQSVLTIAKCWKLKLSDSSVMGFTTHDEEIVYESQPYISLVGFEHKNITATSDMDFDESEALSILNSEYITEVDINAGRYNDAEVEIFVVNYKNLTQGRVLLFKGYLSNIECRDGKFYGTLKGISNKFEKTIGEVFSPLCRGGFCDSRCGLTIANYTFNGTVTSLTDNSQFYCDTSTIKSKSQGYFDYGVITFASGNNNGLSTEVKQFNGGNFILAMAMPYDIAVDDTFSVVAGCDKKFATCCGKFSNGVNFRGEPHLPGIEFLLQSR